MNLTRGLINVLRRTDRVLTRPFRALPTSQRYWERRYARGRNSGAGSRGDQARFKSDVINRLLVEHKVDSAIEFGCGDGYQLGLIGYPVYTGFDVSSSAIRRCREQYCGDSTKAFHVLSEYADQKADLSLSLDVIYHLVEDEIFDQHMRAVFASSRRLVAIYSTNLTIPESEQPPHIRHRRFTDWVDRHASDWRLVERLAYEPESAGDGDGGVAFFVFAR
jgi:hypothetical protein